MCHWCSPMWNLPVPWHPVCRRGRLVADSTFDVRVKRTQHIYARAYLHACVCFYCTNVCVSMLRADVSTCLHACVHVYALCLCTLGWEGAALCVSPPPLFSVDVWLSPKSTPAHPRGPLLSGSSFLVQLAFWPSSGALHACPPSGVQQGPALTLPLILPT